MDPLPDTQESSETQPLTQSQEINLHMFWGQLVALRKTLNSIDLYSFSFGRHPTNTLVATQDRFGQHLEQISKFHFVIKKDNNMIRIKDLSTNGTFINGQPVGKSSWRTISHEDNISINSNKIKIFSLFLRQYIDTTIFPQEFKNKFSINSILGSGAGGQVYSITDKKTCKQYAAKVVLKSLTSHKKYFESEVRIMKSLNHPNILHLNDYFETSQAVYLILDYMLGGDLLKRIRNCGRLSEEESQHIFYQILLAVDYIHHKEISHRDLKLENILLSSHHSFPLIKVSDFGLSKEMARMKTCCGTPSYTAPEVLKFQPYNQSIDIWSMGVILYICLSGTHPFMECHGMSVREKIIRGNYTLKNEYFTNVSDDAKNLIKQMLTVNPVHRITIGGIFSHPWMKNAKMVYELKTKSNIESSDEDILDTPPPKRAKVF